MPRDLIDTDGENRAVRSFLMLYGQPGLTVGAMRKHLIALGFPHWPEWVEFGGPGDAAHLTKGGAQHWLRHLFALEAAHGVGVSHGKTFSPSDADGAPLGGGA